MRCLWGGVTARPRNQSGGQNHNLLRIHGQCCVSQSAAHLLGFHVRRHIRLINHASVTNSVASSSHQHCCKLSNCHRRPCTQAACYPHNRRGSTSRPGYEASFRCPSPCVDVGNVYFLIKIKEKTCVLASKFFYSFLFNPCHA